MLSTSPTSWRVATRGAAKANGTYAEPGDEEGLPGPGDGTSSTA